MRARRSLVPSGWMAPLLLCIALAVGLGSSSVERGPLSLETAREFTQAPPAPVLLGRGADDGDGRRAGAVPVLADGAGDEVRDRGPADGARAEEPVAAAAAGDAHVRNGAALTAAHPLVSPVIEIQVRHTRDLLAHPLVVGTATGMNERGEIALVVLAKAPIADLPSTIDGAPVMVYVTGELFASKGGGKGNGGGKKPKPPPVDPTARFDRPVPIGVSCGHPDITAGTIGCRVTDGANVFALSNNHVYADENLASLGDAVIQPGTFDGGTSPADDMGTLDAFVALDFSGGTNTMDAAIALTDTATLGNATPADGYGLPKSATVSPAINLRVRKYGRTTGQTNGKIFAINASLNVGYETGTAFFTGQVMISPGSFSLGGDSGALIVVQKGKDARKPVALLFAGSPSSTVATPIDPILSAFGVSIDGE